MELELIKIGALALAIIVVAILLWPSRKPKPPAQPVDRPDRPRGPGGLDEQ